MNTDENNHLTEEKRGFSNLYLETGRLTGQNQWWMYAFTLVFTFFVYAGVLMGVEIWFIDILKGNNYSESEILKDGSLLFSAEALQLDMNVILLLELLAFLGAFIGFNLSIRFVQLKSLSSVISSAYGIRYKRILFSFSVWALLVGCGVVTDMFINSSAYTFNFNLKGFILSTLIIITLVPVQSLLEELFFRGLLLQGLAQLFKNGIIPLILTSAFFGMAHISNPEVKQFGTAIMLSYYISFGLFMGAITLIDEGLELAIGIHIANNVLGSILVSDKHSVIRNYALFESADTSAEFDLWAWFIMAAIALAAFWIKYRWKNLKLIIR